MVTTFNFNNVQHIANASRTIEQNFHRQFEYCKCMGEWFDFSYGEKESIIKLSQQKIANVEDWFDIYCSIGEIAQKAVEKIFEKYNF